MEFWGKEVKPGPTVSCEVDDDMVVHLSQIALGELKKASENVIVSVKVDDKKIVLGTLSAEKHPHITCDLVFDKDFELSHNSKTASVFFSGYKSPIPYESYSGEDSSDEELETDQIPSEIPATKVPVKGGMKVESSSSDDDDDFTGSESDREMSDEDDSSDEDELSSGADPSDDSDDSGSEEETPTPKKTDVVVGKKRAIEVEAPSGKKAKSEQSAQKTGDKVAKPADKSTKTPTTDKKSPKSHACKSCNKSFSSASGLESHQKAKKHEA